MIRAILIQCVKGYQRILSPVIQSFGTLIGISFHCKYPVSCSEFAIFELQNSSNVAGSLLRISRRLLSCAPWNFMALRRRST